MKKTKHILSILLILSLLFFVIPFVSLAATSDESVYSGYCGIVDDERDGTNLEWMLDNSGTLTISGTGEMMDYSYRPTNIAPWNSQRKHIRAVRILKGVTGIGQCAFYDCTNLTSVDLPITLTSIGGGAFRDCSSLANINIPSTVKNIGGDAFRNCTELTSFSIPNGVTIIRGYTFFGCFNLRTVTIPNSVTFISSYAFAGCISLSSITIPDSVTDLGSSVFSGCTSLESVFIPNKVSFGSSCFQNCTGLTTAIFQEGGTDIGQGTFIGCTQLTSVNIPEGVIAISEWVFYGCSSLASIDIPNSVVSIADEAFRGCSSLTSVTIPNNVREIGPYAFCDCTSLTCVTFMNDASDVLIRDNPFGFFYKDGRMNKVPGFQVTGYTDSSAHQYAKKYGFEFIPLDHSHTLGAVAHENITVSTCTASGCFDEVIYCTTCGEELSRVTIEQPLAAHTTTIINAKDATYESGGYTGDTYCTVCKQTLSFGSAIPKLTKPDEPTNPTDSTQPTTQQQQQSGSCKYCGGSHSGFPGVLIGFFHSILALFGLRK